MTDTQFHRSKPTFSATNVRKALSGSEPISADDIRRNRQVLEQARDELAAQLSKLGPVAA